MSTRWHSVRAHLRPLLGLRPWRQHSRVLAVGGAVYLLVGISYLFAPADPDQATTMRIPLALGGMDTWGAVWITVGLLAFASTRWPPASETWGYTAMASLSALWSCFYVGAMVLGAPNTTSRAVLVWALFAFMWLAVSGLRNPEEQLTPEAAPTEGR